MSGEKVIQMGPKGFDSSKALDHLMKEKTQPLGFQKEGEITDEDIAAFDKMTKHIKQNKIPHMPRRLKNLKDYLDEYNLIQKSKCKLSYNQRTRIKNVIHEQVRMGNITLKLAE